MLLVGEILLTVVAWRRGWGPAAALPVVLGVVAGLFIAATLPASTTTALLGDLACVAVLIVMSVRKRNPATPAPTGAMDTLTPAKG